MAASSRVIELADSDGDLDHQRARYYRSAAPGSVEPGAWVCNFAPHVVRVAAIIASRLLSGVSTSTTPAPDTVPVQSPDLPNTQAPRRKQSALAGEGGLVPRYRSRGPTGGASVRSKAAENR
jgi:hypothetical protein